MAAILFSGKVNFNLGLIKRDNKGHQILFEGITQSEEIIITNVYTPNTGAPDFIKQRLLNIKD